MGAFASDITKALFGIWLILKNRPGADNFFDLSVDGFWRSFVAAILVLPANVIVTAVGILAAGEVSYGLIDGFRDLLLYVINWLFYPLVVIIACRYLNAPDKALKYIIPYNWASIPTGYFFAFATLIGKSLEGSSFGAGVLFIAYVVAIFLFFEIARRQLEISRLAAVGVVAFDFLFSITLISTLGSLR
tara:strand:+ start:37 stop:603 length:567 start_codon:yes stop_codon:yes gene_type:complete